MYRTKSGCTAPIGTAVMYVLLFSFLDDILDSIHGIRLQELSSYGFPPQ
jgi:hypothetical protein